MRLERVSYRELNARQKENYNFQKVSAVLADYGFVALRLSDDWAGADFIGVHVTGETLRVQLKSRLSFQRNYMKKDLYIAFPYQRGWFLYPHDELLEKMLPRIANTVSWSERGSYSFKSLSLEVLEIVEPYRISGGVGRIDADAE